VLQALLQVSQLQATPVVSADLAALGRLLSGLGESAESQALLMQAALAASVVGVVALARTAASANGALVLALIAFVPTALTGHAAGDGLLGWVSLVLHATAAALWVGGLAALCWVALRGRTPLANAIPRYSVLALGCVITLAHSGVVTAAVRLGSFDALFNSSYGVIVLAKVAALILLTGFGWLHRQHTVHRLRSWHSRNLPAATRVFMVLASVELALMAATVALAVGLSRTPPPPSAGNQTSVNAGPHHPRLPRDDDITPYKAQVTGTTPPPGLS
jgi:putative copper export protein